MPETHDDERADLLDALDAAARHAARLVRAYGWLAVLTEPGREPRPAPPLLTDDAIERIRADEARELAERAAAMRAGARPAPVLAGPSSAPARLDVLDTQIRVVRGVGRLVHRVSRRPGPWRWTVPMSPGEVVTALDWIAGDGGPPIWVATPAGVVYRRGVLADLAETYLAEQVAERLADLATMARAAAGITTERIAPYPAGACPACGRRSLQIDATLASERWWTVHCISESCRCAGPGCGCAQRYPIEGRRHAWSYGELGRLDWAVARRRRRHPIRSAARGHGRWSSRYPAEWPDEADRR